MYKIITKLIKINRILEVEGGEFILNKQLPPKTIKENKKDSNNIVKKDFTRILVFHYIRYINK